MMEKLAATIDYGPELERSYVSAGLDYYKLTMSQLAFEKEPDSLVTFTLKNRGAERLADYLNFDQLNERFDFIRQNGFNSAELSYLSNLRDSKGQTVFTGQFLEALQINALPKVEITTENDDIAVKVTGPHYLATFWETVVMSEINEAYFENYIRENNLDIIRVYDEGQRRLNRKMSILRQHPDIKFADFGTRRHFSYAWQKHVIDSLKQECPANFIGTSNVVMSASLGTKPIGTYAHEMPMVYAGLADARSGDVRASHQKFLDDWYDRYGDDLSIALTDTFGSDFFFEDFTLRQAQTWHGVRHDSGDPVEFGDKTIQFYEDKGIDPRTKTIIFSDSLDIETIVELNQYFRGRINAVFGWGTNLTNDLGIKPLNIVMKVTAVKDGLTGKSAETVKISDDDGKHTGPQQKIKQYQRAFGVMAMNVG